MKRCTYLTRALPFALAASIFPGSALCAPGDGIAGTHHDFSGTGDPGAGLCTYCHTPHKAVTQDLLWSHTLSTNTFSWSVSQTAGGTPYPTFRGDTYRGSTAKCLGCHDGSVAIGDLVWWNGGPPAPLDVRRISGGARMGPDGNMGSNHPVAMPYPFQNVKGAYNGVTTGAGFRAGEWVADPTTRGIRLYNDDGAKDIRNGPVVGRSGIECGSCHDPHNGPDVQDGRFLRGTAGGICDKCHVK